MLGPVIVNAIADARIEAGVAGPGRYTASFTIMVGLLVVGFVCNELIRPVSERYHEPALAKAAQDEDGGAPMSELASESVLQRPRPARELASARSAQCLAKPTERSEGVR